MGGQTNAQPNRKKQPVNVADTAGGGASAIFKGQFLKAVRNRNELSGVKEKKTATLLHETNLKRLVVIFEIWFEAQRRTQAFQSFNFTAVC